MSPLTIVFSIVSGIILSRGTCNMRSHWRDEQRPARALLGPLGDSEHTTRFSRLQDYIRTGAEGLQNEDAFKPEVFGSSLPIDDCSVSLSHFIHLP